MPEINTQNKYSNFDILKAYITKDPDKLRANGYTPESLYLGCKQSYADNEKLRGEAQCHLMTRFKPSASEAAIYEQSGNLLFHNALDNQAREHWQIAFDQDHRPINMTANLGHQSLKLGYLPEACTAFSYLTDKIPTASYLQNELGVAKYMLALKQKSSSEFETNRQAAISCFDRASEHVNDPIAQQNKEIASTLTSEPKYHKPEKYLHFKQSSSTRMIDAIIQDLDKHKCKTVPKPLGIPFITVPHTIPNIPNQMALLELEKIKQEQPSEETHSIQLKKCLG